MKVHQLLATAHSGDATGDAALAVAALWGMSVRGLEAAETTAYVEKATWAETMIASRAKLAREPQAPVALDLWYMTGPHPARNIKHALFPESGVDLSAEDRGGKPLWTACPQLTDGQVHALPSG